MRKLITMLIVLITSLGFSLSVSATTCAEAVVVPGAPVLPWVSTLTCGTLNDITSANATACGSSYYLGGLEAVYVWTPDANYINATFAYSGQAWSGVMLYQGCPTAGGTCIGNVTGSGSAKTLAYVGTNQTSGTTISLTAGVTYYIVIDTWPTPDSPCPGTLTIDGTVSIPCSGTPAPGNTLASASPVCPGTNFTLSLQNVTPGTGVTYLWETSPDNSTWTATAATAATYTTTQTVATWYRCQVTCAGNTGISTPVQVGLNTNFLQCYCPSGATSTADEEIYSVTVNGATNAYDCFTVAPGTGSILNRYSNFFPLGSLTSMFQSGTFSFSIQQDECDGADYYSNGCAIWIDFNQDGDFGDAGEQVFVESVTTQGPRTITGTITVPLGAVLGQTAMRITVAEGYSGTGLLPCLSYGYGETEDYLVTITPAPACIPPAVLTATNISGFEATLGWTEQGTATSWDIEWGATPFTPTGTPTVSGITNPYILTGLTPVTGYAYYVRSNCGGGVYSTWSGPKTFTTTVACPAPTTLTASNITSTSAELGWTSTGTLFDIEWMLSTATATGTPNITGVANPYVLSGLLPATSYKYYVRQDCGVNGTSTWAGPFTLTTLCEVIVPAYTQNFDGTTFPPVCWSRANGQLLPTTTLTGTTSNWIQDNWRGITGTDKSARLNIWSTGLYGWLFTPQIDLGDGSIDYQLEFDASLNAYGSSNPPGTTGTDDKFAVVISTDGGVTWTSANTLRLWDNAGSPYVYNNISYLGERFIIPLTGYTGVVKIGFYGESTVSNADNNLHINNMVVQEIPLCPPPTGLTATNVIFKRADIGWSGAAVVDIDWGPAGHAAGTGTIITGVTDNPYSLTGLSPVTSYHVYIRANCDTNGVSTWAGPLAFTTPDEASVSVYPFNVVDATGYVTNGTTLKKGPWMNISTTVNDTSGRAYMKFDLSSIPYNAIISKAVLNYYNFYREGTSSAANNIYPLTNDPVTAPGATLYNDCGDGDLLWSGGWAGTAPTWLQSQLNATGVTFVSDQLANGWVGFGIVRGSSFLYRMSGYDDATFRPYLTLDYSVPTAPRLGVSPNTKNFGQINVGLQSVAEPFRIKNIGIDTLDVTAVTIVGTDSTQFILTDGATYPVLLPEAQFYYVNVAFKPTSTGVKTASLKVTAEGVDYLFPLTGTGYLNGPRDLVATPIFGPYVELTWNPPLPFFEIRYDDNSIENWYWVNNPTGAQDYFATKVTIPTAGSLHTIGLLTRVNTTPNVWQSIMLCPEVGGKPDLLNPIESFLGQTVTSTTGEWFLLNLTSPLSVTAGTNYYIVTHWPSGSTDGPFVATDETTNSGRSTWTADGGTTWNAIPYAFLMRAYMTPTGKAPSGSITLTSGKGLPELAELGASALSVEPKTGLSPAPSVAAPSILAPESANKAFVDYTLHRGTTSGVYNVHIPGITTRSYTDVTTAPSTTYYYVVTAEFTDDSVNSNQAVVTTFALCPTQTSLNAENITQNSANLVWTANGTTNWEIEWGLQGFTPGAGTLITNVTANPYPLTGLAANTSYGYRVRANCGGGLYSSWSAVYNFTTVCPIALTPFTEGFETSTFPPVCWSRTTGTQQWNRSTAASGYGTGTGSAYANFYSYSSATPFHLMTLAFNAAGLDSPVLKFDHAYRTYAGEVDRMEVYYSTNQGSTYTLLQTYLGGNSGPLATATASTTPFTPTSAQWATKTIPLPAGTNMIRFTAVSAYGNNLYLDNVIVEGASLPCLTPTALTATDITSTSAKLNWTENSGATNWDIEWGPTGFTPGTGTMISGTTIKPYILSGLTGNTTYDFYVRAICSAGNISPWSSVYTFTTQCAAVPVPFSENFDVTVVPDIPVCWNVHSSVSGVTWETSDAVTSGGIAPKSAPNFASVFSSFSDPKDEWLVSPGIQMTGGNSYEVTFWVKAPGIDPIPEKMKLVVTTDPSLTGCTSGTVLWNRNDLMLADYTQFVAPFDPAVSGVYYFAWHAYSEADVDYIALDDISIDVAAPDCIEPTGVTASMVGSSFATLSWTAPVPAPGSGYEYEVRTSGEAGSGPAGLAASGSTAGGVTTAMVTGLTESTLYHVYLRSNCGDNVYSVWTADYQFTTSAALAVNGTALPASCPDECDGSITTTVVGGVPPYTYSWNTGSSQTDLMNLCPGTYSVTVSDASLNTATNSWVVDFTNPVCANVTVAGVYTTTECFDATNTITVAGLPAVFEVEGAGDVTFIAGAKILFLPGTKVTAPGYMHGYIAPSGPFCSVTKLTEVSPKTETSPLATERTWFTLYPNPTNGDFTLVQKGEQAYSEVRIEVFSMSGEKVLTESMVGAKHEFRFSNMPTGLYFVKVVAEGYVETIKLVKTR